MASSKGYLGNVRELLQANSSAEHIRAMHPTGTALAMASREGHADIVRLLLETDSSEAHIRMTDEDGDTARGVAKNDEIKALLR